KLVLAGHSQGGGEAAFIAKLRLTSGVAMFSSPEDAAVHYPAACVDATAGAALPLWIRWSAGSDGPDPAPCRNAAPATPPFNDAHRLYTNTDPIGIVTPYHDSTVVDLQTPPCPTGTHPLLMPAWRQMLLGAGGFAKAVPQGCDG